jgi:hypothetical protein
MCFSSAIAVNCLTVAICELGICTYYNVAELTVVDGNRGSGWLTGSRPRRILLALWLSFSQAWARICSACTEVRCAGVGRVWSNKNIIWTCDHLKIMLVYDHSQQYDNIPHTRGNRETLTIGFFMSFIPFIFLYSIFSKPTKKHKLNTIKQIKKHTSYQVTTPTCFGTKMQLSGSLSTTKFCRSNTCIILWWQCGWPVPEIP